MQADVSLARSALQLVWVRVLTFIISFKNDVKSVTLERRAVSGRQSGVLLHGQVVIIVIWQRENVLAQNLSRLQKRVCGGREAEERRSGLKHPENIHTATLLGPAV